MSQSGNLRRAIRGATLILLVGQCVCHPPFVNAGPLGTQVGVDPRPGADLPLELSFHDSDGRPVVLRELFRGKPVILTPVYYRCPMLCGLELSGLVRALRALPLTPGSDFDIVTFSIDPAETPPLAAAKKATYLRSYGRTGAESAWHFLTGNAEAVRTLSQAIGFKAARNEQTGQYAHSAAIIVCTPDGQVSHYLYGVDFAPRDLRLALVEASDRRIGTLGDQVMLYCYQYDPAQGKFGLAVMNVVRAGGIVTVLVLGTSIGVMLRRERRRQPSNAVARPSLDKPSAIPQSFKT